jgi:hypothetical protein
MRVFNFLTLIVLGGCITLAHQNIPYTTKKEQLSWGLSVSGYGLMGQGVLTGLPVTVPDFYMRYGIADNVDIGFSFSGFPFIGATHIDLKTSFVNTESFAAAFSPGLSFAFLPVELGGTRNLGFVAPSMTLSIGSNVVYGGMRFQYIIATSEVKEEICDFYPYYCRTTWTRTSFSFLLPYIFWGFTLGTGNFKFTPEFGVGFPLATTGTVTIGAFIFSYTFGFLYIP